MADDDLRRLERRWRETQEPADEGRFLLARMRAGELKRSALELAALLGQPGAAAALPELSAPRPDSEWASEVRELAGSWPQLGWRLLLAECERVLALIRAEPAPDFSRLIMVEGPQRGSEILLLDRRPVSLDRSGARVGEGESVVSFHPQEGPGEWWVRGKASQFTLNGERLASARALQHGDWLDLGESCLIFDGGEGAMRSDEIGIARAWLDELWRRVRGSEAEDLPPLWIEAGVGRDWLRSELTRLDPVLCSQEPVALASWPARLGGARDVQAGAREVAEWALGREPSAPTRALRALDRLEVASPCPLSWENLTHRPDDPRVRDCSQCQHEVYDLRELTKAEAADLVTREGRVCVRLYRRPDGSVMTRDCPNSFPFEAPDDMVTLGMLA